MRSGYRTVVAWPRRGDGERAAYNLARLRASWLAGRRRRLRRGAVAALRAGVAARGLRRAGAEARGHPRPPAASPPARRARWRRARRRSRRARRRARGALRSFTDLRAGDIVVHEDHGVARFAGFETRTVAGVTRDYLYLEYQGDDRVFVPTDQLAKISRYVGAGGEHPPLSKLGGTRWDTMKARARRAAQELAGELLALYAERRRRTGHAFAADGDWQREFEQALPLHRDARPARGDRARQGRHGGAAADGPADLRRRRLRQDRGRAARGVQGGRRRQAGADARADDDPRAAALRDLPRAPRRLPVHDRPRLALSQGGRAARGPQALRRGTRRHPDRHAPPALARRAREGPRPADRRRGAALRRQAEGAPAPDAAARRRDLDVGDADPAHAADVARRAARHLRDRDAARGAPSGAAPTSASTTRRSSSARSSASARAAARRSTCTTASRRSTRSPSGCARCARACASPSRTARWTRASSRP